MGIMDIGKLISQMKKAEQSLSSVQNHAKEIKTSLLSEWGTRRNAETKAYATLGATALIAIIITALIIKKLKKKH